jgi:hypothetical protein
LSFALQVSLKRRHLSDTLRGWRSRGQHSQHHEKLKMLQKTQVSVLLCLQSGSFIMYNGCIHRDISGESCRVRGPSKKDTMFEELNSVCQPLKKPLCYVSHYVIVSVSVGLSEIFADGT